MQKRRLLIVLAVVAAVFASWAAGRWLVETPSVMPSDSEPNRGPVYSSGWQDRAFFDRAYGRGETADQRQGERDGRIVSVLSAHHLLVADKMAQVFETIATQEPVTLVMVGPNHFELGVSPAQVSFGNWETPYGIVESDRAAVQRLLDASNTIAHEELAQALGEHSVAALTPFVARSLPNARVVSMLVHDSLTPHDAWALGETIARELPDAILIASVDMAHYMDTDATAAVDAEVLARLETRWFCGGAPCLEDVEIDSNATMRVLAGFNETRGTTGWTLTHHGSSLGMGAAQDPAENTSHILGYFTL